jgi:hypothetical protein
MDLLGTESDHEHRPDCGYIEPRCLHYYYLGIGYVPKTIQVIPSPPRPLEGEKTRLATNITALTPSAIYFVFRISVSFAFTDYSE